MDYTISGFVFGFFISWSIGLLPAFIYRYAIYKQPIEGNKVFWRLAPIVIIMAFLFKMTNAVLSGKPPNGNPTPWIIIYYIGKWIMTRQPKTHIHSEPVNSNKEPLSAPPPPFAGFQDISKESSKKQDAKGYKLLSD